MSFTKIKLNLILLCVAFFSGIGVFSLNSCRKDRPVEVAKTTEKFQKLKNVPEVFNAMGQLHGEALDSIFENFRTATEVALLKNSQASISSLHSLIPYESIAENTTLKFLKSNSSTKSYYSTKSAVDPKLHFTDAMMKAVEKRDFTVKGLNEVQQALVDEAHAALQGPNGRRSQQDLKGALEKINEKASKLLTENEANIIYGTTSALFSSYQYWKSNYRKWVFLLAYPKVARDFKGKDLNRLVISTKFGKQAKTSGIYDETYYGGILPEITITPDMWEPSWDDGVDSWWDTNCYSIMDADATGATVGIISGTITGLLPGAVTGAICGFVIDSSVSAVKILLRGQ